MSRYIEGQDRQQVTLLPDCLDDFIAEDNPIRVVDAFVAELDLKALGFEGSTPAATGRPSYHPAVLLKIYIYGYLNRVQSSRRLERECQRNVELMWLTSRLAPDFKTIADFRRDNGTGIRNVCRRFVTLCRELKLFSQALVAIDGSKFKAVISAVLPKPTTSNAKAEGRFDRADFIYIKEEDEYQCPAGQRAIYRFSREENGLMIRRYWSSACKQCPIKVQCTPSDYRRISRWEDEEIVEAVQRRLDRSPQSMTIRRRTVEHVFGTLKSWMGYTHFLTKRLANVGTEMSLHVLAYNLRRVIAILGFDGAVKAIKLVGA